MKKIINVCKQMSFTIVISIVYISNTFAGSIQSSKLFTGATSLAQDITSWITGAASIFCGLMIGYCFLRKMGAEPDKARQYNDRIKMIAGCLIGIIVLMSLINIVISYFQ